MKSKLLNEKEAAKYLGLTTRALQNWRYTGEGPVYIRISSRCIRYREEDIESFVDTRMRKSTAERNVEESNNVNFKEGDGK